MFILSPKTKFLGGALVSASHLGKLFPGKLALWKNGSEFLDRNQVQYKVVDQTDFLPGNTIWCNDTCVDEGYFDHVHDKNLELWKFLSVHKFIHLVNHQPINRCAKYLIEMIDYLRKANDCTITIYNYRACWNDEWNNELACIFPDIKVYTLPYHYYFGYVPTNISLDNKVDVPVAIGRSNSKCKIQYQFESIKTLIPSATQIEPDVRCNNTEFLEVISKYKYVLTGYYYGGEGNPEMTTNYNKLEWSFMDALLCGCIPMTNSLFELELKRLNIPAPIIGYQFENLNNIKNILENTPLQYPAVRKECIESLKNELSKGNLVMERLICSD